MFHQPYPSFALNTHTVYMLKHYIDIAFILQNNHNNASPLYFNKLIQFYNYCLMALLIFLMPIGTELELHLDSQSSAGKTCDRGTKTLYLYQCQNTAKM